ncbi:hypothetical protein [Sulfurimonas sp. CS5]|uniref:hypothetical protein n=1 Tax=Sulfurimonas sp. CS5 TaxID=3391145 RepID=UPI0039EB3102
MTALSKNKISSLAKVLENKDSVEFNNDGFYYEIFESAEGGYIVNVYSSHDEDVEYIEANLIDGGHCSGSPRDAVRFML